MMSNRLVKLKQAFPLALAVGIWFSPVPEGLTAPAWHLFAVFVSAIASVLVGAFPLLTSTMLAVGAVVLTGTVSPAKAFAGFANASVLLVAIALPRRCDADGSAAFFIPFWKTVTDTVRQGRQARYHHG